MLKEFIKSLLSAMSLVILLFTLLYIIYGVSL